MAIKDLFFQGMMNGTIQRIPIPDYFETSLSKLLRPYQKDCFLNFLMYMGNNFDGKQIRPHLLFHMATGSGKTLIMAGAMLYLYELGYRNFLFFVDSTNIVEKTKDNFINASSSKYLFAPQIMINGKHVEIRKVDNFQGSATDCINLCLCTIQGLHIDLNSEKENSLTYDDFTDQPVVLISDEAHHMNSATRRGNTSNDDQHTNDWESTVMRIFNKDNGSLPNVLLEFTATADLTDNVISQKYENKVIFDYPLKKFREDLYSKDVEVIQSDLEPLDMALQAMIMSQYKRKLFADIGQDIKPVVLFKSKTINANKEIFKDFKQAVADFNETGIEKIRSRANGDLASAFDYFSKHNITADNLILELREEFAKERLLLVDGNNISPQKQQLLNSLEEPSNIIRAIFAVDMLNEGWDVLNLYDIVRLYNTRDAANNHPGKTTMQEAQLIGRGARYMPFKDPNNIILDIDRRKYDGDGANPLRVIEKLHYHSAHNPRYIQELHTALIQTGIIANNRIQLDLYMKDDFKKTNFYNKGLVFLNKRVPLSEAADDGTIGPEILQKAFNVTVHTGQMHTSLVFSDGVATDNITNKIISIKFKEIESHVIRAALNSYTIFHFDVLKKLYPQLKSIIEFVTSDKYLANLNIKVIGNKDKLCLYSQKIKLEIAKTVIGEIEPILITRGKTYRGSKTFSPYQFKDKFRNRIRLNVTINTNSNKEFGVSMKTPKNPKYALDLMNVEWYAYNDNFGTSEEKALVKYIEGIMPKLKEKYDEIYLVRNEKDAKIYSFDTGQVFEPDFLLFLRIKGTIDKYDNLQLFIEPKGDGLLIQDKWKNDFLKQIRTMAEVTWCTNNDDFHVWGIPFFNEAKCRDFESAMNDEIINYNVTPHENKRISIFSSSEIKEDKKYVDFLPLYHLRAACGYFEENITVPEEDIEGWVDVSASMIRAREGMFVIHAVGDSMLPKIKNGDLCVFERYGLNNAGSRNGEIVLTECPDKDTDTDCHYTIKRYHSEKVITGDSWYHKKIELQPLNPNYKVIELDENKEYRTLGILKAVL